MRKVLVLLILAAGAWYVMRRRRVYAPESWQGETPAPWNAPAPADTPSGAEQGQGARAPSGDGRQAATPAQASPISGVAESSVESAAAGADAPTGVADTPPAETAAEDEGAPEGRRTIAGEGTTTAGGGAVDSLSSIPDGHTSSGVVEPLPPELAADEHGTGGPADSSQAPSAPDSTQTPTTGMEHAPQIDREDVLERTGGAFVGNKKTRVYHPAGSNHLPAEENRVYFDSEEEAVAAGFRPSARAGGESAQA